MQTTIVIQLTWQSKMISSDKMSPLLFFPLGAFSLTREYSVSSCLLCNPIRMFEIELHCNRGSSSSSWFSIARRLQFTCSEGNCHRSRTNWNLASSRTSPSSLVCLLRVIAFVVWLIRSSLPSALSYLRPKKSLFRCPCQWGMSLKFLWQKERKFEFSVFHECRKIDCNHLFVTVKVKIIYYEKFSL